MACRRDAEGEVVDGGGVTTVRRLLVYVQSPDPLELHLILAHHLHVLLLSGE